MKFEEAEGANQSPLLALIVVAEVWKFFAGVVGVAAMIGFEFLLHPVDIL